MGHTITLAAVGAVAFMVLDGVWLGVLMKNFYRAQLAPIVRLADSGIAPNWPAAFVVYALLGTGIAVLVIPRASTVSLAAAYGALFGLVVYGVYDFTNYSTLRQWPSGVPFGEKTTPLARAVSHPRGCQADRHRDRYAARMGAPSSRRHSGS